MAKLTNQSEFNNVAFGQLGSAYQNQQSDKIQPPTGMVIVAIQFLKDTTLNDLVSAEPDNLISRAHAANSLSVNSPTAVEGAGGIAIPNTAVFPKGMTIYGRWTEVSMQSSDDTAGGYIVYFGH